MILLLVAALVLGLLLIPFGLPGLWVMVGAAVGYSLLVPGGIGTVTLVLVSAAALGAELLEWSVTGRFTRRYGGSRRASWGAIFGSMVGAMVGVPLPIVGSVIGAFAGAFAGALAGELTQGSNVAVAGRVATGALLGRAAATALKVGIGVAMSAWILVTALV
ncbi:MAG: DUF456 domain-containing protein [Gemmatimonadota bacterium]|nr:DUF456 domain-containing protein [Gemmatimonadota bacterium]